MKNELTVPIIGIVHSPFHEKFGIPRQPNLVQVPAIIEFFKPYDQADAFIGLKEFSHLWLTWCFHDNKQLDQKKMSSADKFRPLIRPPRLGGNQKVGVFASRSMYRPAPLGLSVVELVDVIEENQKVSLLIRGADLLNGTPIIDIKPYIAYSDAIPQAKSGFANAAPERLSVSWDGGTSAQLEILTTQNILKTGQQALITELLALDPRPAYQDDPERVYGMRYDQVNVLFKVVAKQINVISIDTI